MTPSPASRKVALKDWLAIYRGARLKVDPTAGARSVGVPRPSSGSSRGVSRFTA